MALGGRLSKRVAMAVALAAIALGGSSACATSIPADPTPARPRIGCVGNPMGDPSAHGRLLPRRVIIVAVHSDEFYWGYYPALTATGSSVIAGPPVLIRRDDVHWACKGAIGLGSAAEH